MPSWGIFGEDPLDMRGFGAVSLQKQVFSIEKTP